MRQHRIIFKHGLYIPQYKGWLFWHDYSEFSGAGSYTCTFGTRAKAVIYVMSRIKMEKKWNQPSEVVWRDGCPS